MNWVYLLQCTDGSYYTGWTNRLEHRLEQHRIGRASKYTRARRPVVPVLFLYCVDDRLARSVEKRIKQLPRAEKTRLIHNPPVAYAFCLGWSKENPPVPLTPVCRNYGDISNNGLD